MRMKIDALEGLYENLSPWGKERLKRYLDEGGKI